MSVRAKADQRPPTPTAGVRALARARGADAPEPEARSGAKQPEAGGARSAPLVHREQSFTPQQQAARRERYRRRSEGQEWLIRRAREVEGLAPVAAPVIDMQTGEIRRPRAGDQEWVRPPRVARCSWRVGEVGVHAEGGSAHFSGTERCGSIWACPVCASVIRPERAQEVQHAVTQHTEQGGALLFVTLTLRHHKGQALADTLDAVLTCWQKMLRGKAWGTTKDRYGIEGYIRSIEVTVGENGWHPHAHVIFFLRDAISEGTAQALGDELHGRWARYVTAATGKTPTRRSGVDVQRVTGDGKVVAQYLAKMQEDHVPGGPEWDVGAEMARSDVKRGRGRSSLVPFELLDLSPDRDLGDDDSRRRLWVEYVEATKGRRAITWSRGLKARYAVEDRSDDEIIEDTERAPLRYVADGPAYDRLRRRDPVGLAMVLDAAERDDWAMVERLLPGVAHHVEVPRPLGRDPVLDAARQGGLRVG